MTIDIKLVGLFIFLLAVSPSVWADDICPNGTDPIYCKLAQETGGKVYGGKDIEKNMKLMLEDEKKRRDEAENRNMPAHTYSSYSKDIGCSEFKDARSLEICNSISENLEWGWTGHGMFNPGWEANWNTARNVFCQKKINELDLPVLEKMCGGKLELDIGCINAARDGRLTFLIGTLATITLGLKDIPNELKGTVYDPHSTNYLLINGCPK